jgi:hypothetical protein
MNYSIVDTFPKTRWPELNQFIKQTHGDKHVMQNKELFEWFYSPIPDQNVYNMIVGLKNNQVISILGYLPTKFLVNGKFIAGAWTALWFSLPEERSGIGALLMKRLMEMYPIVAGQGASAMNKKIVEAMGHEFEPIIPKVVGVIDKSLIQNLLQQPNRFNKCLIIPTNPSKFKPSRSLTREINWENYSNIKFGTLRDADYIHRKYMENPFLKYELITAGDDRTPTIVILRIIQTSLGFKVARIVEFFGPNISDNEIQWNKALEEVLLLADKRKCAYIDFYSTSTMINNFLIKMGFYEDNEGLLPSLLDPVESDRKSQNLELFVEPSLRAAESLGINDFFVTRGDGDQDRPNASYEILTK